MNTKQELEQLLKELDQEIKRNIEQNAMLHKEKALYKNELEKMK